MELKQTVSKNIKCMRLEMGLTQQELSDRTGLNVRYISRLETIPQNLTLEILQKLAIGLDKPAGDLVSPISTGQIQRKNIDSLHKAIHLLNSVKNQLSIEEDEGVSLLPSLEGD